MRFIEYMPFDGNKWNYNKMLTYKDILYLIRVKYPNFCKLEDGNNDTAKVRQLYYDLDEM